MHASPAAPHTKYSTGTGRSDSYATLLSLLSQINPTTIDWLLDVAIVGRGFSGPSTFTVSASSTSHYPLTFNPRREGRIEVYQL